MNVAKHNARTAIAAIKRMDTLAELDQALADESAGPKRKTVLAAIEKGQAEFAEDAPVAKEAPSVPKKAKKAEKVDAAINYAPPPALLLQTNVLRQK